MNTRRPRVTAHGTPYELLGLLGEGEFCDVYLARRPDPLQLVVIKAAREPSHAALVNLQMEARVLARLWEFQATSGDYFKSLLPEPVAAAAESNLVFEDGTATCAEVYRWRPGFSFTYEDVRRAYPEGIDARAAVWFFKRSLDTLAWLHKCRMVHTAAIPAHFLVNPLEHGVAMTGFSRCIRPWLEQPRLHEAYRAFYPKEVLEGGVFKPEHDIVMAARSLFYVCGGSPTTGELPREYPGQLADLIRSIALEGSKALIPGASELLLKVDSVARAAFGPPQFHRFEMPARQTLPQP